MLKLSVKWGGVSGGIMTVLLLLSFVLLPAPSPETYGISEIFGYVTIFASLAVIYVAMNELQNGQPVSLWQRISLGVGVSAIAGAIFGLYNVVYTGYLDPDFMDNYYNYYISQLPEQSGPSYEEAVARLEAEKAMFMSPVTQFVTMGATVLLAGIPVSVLLAFLHKARNKQEAA